MLTTHATVVIQQAYETIWSTVVDMHNYWRWNPVLVDVRLPHGVLFQAPIQAKYRVFAGVDSKKGYIEEVLAPTQLAFCFVHIHPKWRTERWQLVLTPLSAHSTQVDLSIQYTGWNSVSAWQKHIVGLNVACELYLQALKQQLERLPHEQIN